MRLPVSAPSTAPRVASRPQPNDCARARSVNCAPAPGFERLPQELVVRIADYVVAQETPCKVLAAVSYHLRSSMIDYAMHRALGTRLVESPKPAVLPQTEWLALTDACTWLESIAATQHKAPQRSTAASRARTKLPDRPAQIHNRLALSADAHRQVQLASSHLKQIGPRALWTLLMPWLKMHSQLGLGVQASCAVDKIILAYRTGARLLDLSGLHLHSVPDCVTLLTQLRHLYLRDNRLKTLPADFGQLTQLQHLWLGDNQLTDLPRSVASLQALRMLSIYNNDLSNLPYAVLRLANLETLDLSYNSFAGFPNGITTLPRLKRLKLDSHLSSLLHDDRARALGIYVTL